MQWKQNNAIKFKLWTWGQLKEWTSVGIQDMLVPLGNISRDHQNNWNQIKKK